MVSSKGDKIYAEEYHNLFWTTKKKPWSRFQQNFFLYLWNFCREQNRMYNECALYRMTTQCVYVCMFVYVCNI